jgi:hypothetical protein
MHGEEKLMSKFQPFQNHKDNHKNSMAGTSIIVDLESILWISISAEYFSDQIFDLFL